MSNITTYFKIVTPKSPNVSVTDSQDISGSRGLYGNHGWYQRIVQGSTTRLVRYREYDVMDNDSDVARALDIMAEEMTGNCPKTRMPLNIMIEAGSERNVPGHVFSTLRAALKTWCKIHNWGGGRLFTLSRNLLKYGDCFFERPKDKNKPYMYIHPKHVVGAVVSEDDITDIRGWYIQRENKKPNQYWQSSATSTHGDLADYNVTPMDKDKIIRFSISDDMSEEAPFGISILRPAYRVFKQKELLEDSILIYRISRAPEKRVFYIDVGNRPDHLVPGVLERFRNQIKQKKVPTRYAGKWQAESVYNPQSMNEDFYFATRPNGNSSRVETLPGGQGLGELTELDYFYRKMWRALRIPSSYLGTSTEDGSSIENEARVGIAYIQEVKFAQFIERHQQYVEEVLDKEFKRWLYDSSISVDASLYRITLPEPSDYAKSRQQAMDADMLNNFSTVDGVPYLSKRFILERYAGLSKDDIRRNEEMIRKEKGLSPTGDDRDLALIYQPEDAEAGGFDGGMGGGGSFGGSPEGENDEMDDTEGTDDEMNVGDEGGNEQEVPQNNETPAPQTP